jgi:hypothetical protein
MCTVSAVGQPEQETNDMHTVSALDQSEQEMIDVHTVSAVGQPEGESGVADNWISVVCV